MTETSPAEPELRDRILDAATRLFALHGYGATSVRQVVEEVGCTKPMLYYYFGSKEELFLTAVRSHVDAFTGIIEQTAARPGTLRERLASFVERLHAQVLENPLAMRLLMTAQHRTEAGQPEIDVMAVHRSNGELLAQLIARGVETGEVRPNIDIRDATLAFIGLVNFRIMICVHEGDHPPDVAGRVLDIFFNGVGTALPAQAPSVLP